MIADDQELLTLSKETPRELFLVLGRPGSLILLVVVLAFVPGILVLGSHQITDDDARWGLASLRLLQADEPHDPIGISDISNACEFSPLAIWNIALSLKFFNGRHATGLLLSSYLAQAGVLLLMYAIGRRLFGTRAGFIGSFVLALHASSLQHVGTPAPIALGLMTVLLTFWGFMRHTTNHVRTVVSLWLLPSGIGLGLSLLISGPLALASLAVLCVYVALGALGGSSGGDDVEHQPPAGNRLRDVWSVLILMLIAFPVGGWWGLRLAHPDHLGESFWPVWLAAGATRDVITADGQSLTGIVGFMIGPALLGLTRTVRLAVRTTPEPNVRPEGPRFLASWTAVSAVVVITGWVAFGQIATDWYGLTTAGIVWLAAVGLEEIALRRVSARVAGGAVVVSLSAIVACTLFGASGANHVLAWMAPCLSITAVLSLLVWWSFRFCDTYESSLRLFLVGCMLSLIATDAVTGLASIRPDKTSRDPLEQLADHLRELPEVESCTFIAVDVPARLKFLFARLWPDSRCTQVDDWSAIPSTVFTEERGPEAAPHAFILYGSSNVPLTTVAGERIQIKAIAPPTYFQSHRLSVFTVEHEAD